jgi:hypothetical protein
MAIRPVPTKNRVAGSGTGEGELPIVAAEPLKRLPVCSNTAVAALLKGLSAVAAENPLFCGLFKEDTLVPAPAIVISADKKIKIAGYSTANTDFMPTPL